MKPLRRLLVATDLSPSSAYAEQRAAQLAAEQKDEATVELVQVLPSSPLQVLWHTFRERAEATQRDVLRSMQEALRQRADALAEQYGVAVSSRVCVGHPPNAIAAAAEAADSDIVIGGGYGADLLRETFLGATAEKVIRLTQRPVLVVKQPPSAPYREALVATDFSAPTLDALALTESVVAAGQVTLLHVYDSMLESTLRYAGVESKTINAYRERAIEEARLTMDSLVSGARMACTPLIVHGHPAAMLRGHAHSLQPDLLVVGKHGQSEVEELLLGSVTKHMLFETDCDLLVVHGPARGGA